MNMTNTKKMKAALYGNCHMIGFEICLKHSKNFMDKFELIKLPYFFESEGMVEKEQLCECDLFIYQEVRDTNKYGVEFCTDRLFGFLPSKCEMVEVPNLYELGYGFFPQNYLQDHAPHYINSHNPAFRGDERGLFVHGDKVLDGMLDMPLRDVISRAHDYDVIKKDIILQMFDKYMKKIMEREKKWDIKIYYYIEQNYKRIQMFNDFGHPTNKVIKEMSRNLLKYIGVEDDLENFPMIFELEEYEDPIYPCVRDVLNLSYQKEFLREQSDKKLVDKMTFNEYICEYYYWNQRGLYN